MVNREHPHGWFGYTISDKERTTNALRLMRWAAPAAVLVVAIVATAVVVLAHFSPLAAAGLLGGGPVATGGVLALRRGRRVSRGR